MNRIDKVKNLTIFADLTATPSSFFFNSNLHFAPDEIHVRQITYSGDPTNAGVYLVWCSLINDYIGSFSFEDHTDLTSVAVNVAPNTVIRCLPSNIIQSIQFQIHTINAQGVPGATSNLGGKLVINLDCIKF